MVPPAPATAEMRTLAVLALDCLTVPTELLSVPARYLIRAEPVPILQHREMSLCDSLCSHTSLGRHFMAKCGG